MPKTPKRRVSTTQRKTPIMTQSDLNPTLQPRKSSRKALVFQTESSTRSAPPQSSLHYWEETSASSIKSESQTHSHTATFQRSLHSKASTSTGFASLSSVYDSADRAVAPASTTTWKQDSEIPLSDPPAPTSLKGAFLKMFSKSAASEQNAAIGSRSASRQSQRVSIPTTITHSHYEALLLTCSTSQRLQVDLPVVLTTERMCCLTFTNLMPLLLQAGRACFARDVLLRQHCRRRSTLTLAWRKAADRLCLCSRP